MVKIGRISLFRRTNGRLFRQFTVKNMVIMARRLFGRILSMVSTSLENLLTILPMGVVSKKDMGDRRFRVRVVSCMRTEAAIQPCATVIDPIKLEKAISKSQIT